MIREVQTATPTLSRGDSFYRGEGTFPQLSSWGGAQLKSTFNHRWEFLRSSTSGSSKKDVWNSVSPGCPAYIALRIVLWSLGDCASTFWSFSVIGFRRFLLLKAYSRKAPFTSSSQMFGIDSKRMWFLC